MCLLFFLNLISLYYGNIFFSITKDMPQTRRQACQKANQKADQKVHLPGTLPYPKTGYAIYPYRIQKIPRELQQKRFRL